MALLISNWFLYLIGVLLHAWLKAGSVIGSKLNGVGTYQQYIAINGPALSMRFFVATLGMLWWTWHPNMSFSPLAHLVGLNIPMNVPLDPVTAGAYGIFADTLLDLVAARIPLLQKEIPPVGGMIVTQKQTTAVTTAETTTEKTTVTAPPPVEVKP